MFISTPSKLKQLIGIFIILFSAVIAVKLYKNHNATSQEFELNKYRGDNAFKSHHYRLAQNYYEKSLSQNPNQAEATLMAAKSFMRGKYQNFNKSIDYYKKYINHFDGNPPLNLSLVNQLKDVGMHDDLIILSSKTHNNLLKASIFEELDTEKALWHLNQIPLDRHNIEYYLLAARIYSNLHQFDNVIINANKAIDLSGMHKNNYYLLSQAYRNIKEFTKAKTAIQSFQILNLLETENNNEQLLIHLNALIELNKNLIQSNDFNSYYITLLIKTKQLDKVEERLSSIDISSLSSKNKVPILSALNQINAIELARIIYNESDKNQIKADEYIQYCQLVANLKTKNELYTACKQGIEKNPHSAALMYWFAIHLLNIDQKPAAYRYMEDAIVHAPWVNSWIIHLAKLYLIEGDVESAKKVLNQSVTNSQIINQFKLSNSLY